MGFLELGGQTGCCLWRPVKFKEGGWSGAGGGGWGVVRGGVEV